MDQYLKTILWQQFGASIDMFGNAVRACPDELWGVRLWGDHEGSEFWYVAYHCLFWLDLYLSGTVEGFTPPPPFTLAELDPNGVLPERPYTPAEILAYLAHCRQKCRTTIEALTDQQAQRVCASISGQPIFAGLLLYNMRHVQEHGAQLNMILGQRIGANPRWVAKARDES